MPDKRLQKCRAVYETVPVLTERDRVDAVIAAIQRGWRPWRGGLPGSAELRARTESAAYRITHAQQVADAKKAER